jgi:hypothetical protein
MYGLDVALVRDALAREPAGSTAVSP